MGFSITNVGKAKDLLKKGGLDIVGIQKNPPVTTPLVLDEQKIMSIINSDKNNIFEVLDQAGKLLRDSWLTRTTSHKTYDFSSIQSSSSLNLQALYNKIYDSYNKVSNASLPLLGFDEIVRIKIKLLYDKFNKSLGKIQKMICSNEAIRNYVLGALGSESITHETINNLDSLISNHVEFTNQNKIQSAEKLEAKHLKSSLVGLGIGSLCSVATGLVVGTSIASFSTGGMMAVAAPIVGLTLGGVTAGVGIAISITAAAGLLIAALVVRCNKERFGTITAKKEAIKINDEFKNALKHLNQAADLVRKNTKQENSEESEVKPTEDQTKAITDFLKEQKELWTPYTTAKGREYTNKSQKDDEKNQHTSGLKKVSDEKTHTIGLLKQGLAAQWCNIEVK